MKEGLREAVLGEIRILSNWVSVDIFRRGVSLKAAECPPTIVITILPETMNEKCKEVVEKVKGHIEKFNLDGAVEVVEGTVDRYKAPYDNEKSVGMGASIALPDGLGGTGTIGGYIQLESAEWAKSYVLSLAIMSYHQRMGPPKISCVSVVRESLMLTGQMCLRVVFNLNA